MSATCRSCGAAIIWARSARGGQLPVDAEPSADGTIELRGAGSSAEAIEHAGRNGSTQGTLHTSHHSTCPFATQRGVP